MRDVLGSLRSWYDSGRPFALATVVGTSKSAPRAPGAAMAVEPGGEVAGSVSGGCVEGAVYELAQDVLGGEPPVLQTYGYSDTDAFAVGLTCGGSVSVFVQAVSAADHPQVGEVLASIESDRPVALATVISGLGQVGSRMAVSAGPGQRHPRRRGPGRGGEAAVGVGALQLLELLVLRGEAALRRDVDDQQHLVAIIREGRGPAIGGLERDVAEVDLCVALGHLSRLRLAFSEPVPSSGRMDEVTIALAPSGPSASDRSRSTCPSCSRRWRASRTPRSAGSAASTAPGSTSAR